MALPLPSVVADVGPGGPLVTSMRGINALLGDIYGNQIKSTEAKYAPVTTLADAMSKVAYSNLMGPQYLAKLFNNPNFVANMKPEELQAARQMVINSGLGQSAFNNALANLGNQKSNNSVKEWFMDKFKNVFGGDDKSSSAPQNIFAQQPNLSSRDQNAIANMSPGDSYQVQGNQGQNPNSGYSYDQNGNNIVASPQEVSQIANNGGNDVQSPVSSNIQSPVTSSTADDYFKQGGLAQGEQKKQEEFGAALGKQNADSVKDLNDSYEASLNASVPINHLIEIVKNPVFQNMRKYPGFQNLQLNYKGTFGNPEEQKLFGDLSTTAMQQVAETVKSFPGRSLAKEFDIANKMKVGPNDTVNNMVGKLSSIKAYNDFLGMRDNLASKIIQKENISKNEALEKADKMIPNANQIRDQIRDDLDNNLFITVRNKKTGETRNISVKEAKRLGVPNV